MQPMTDVGRFMDQTILYVMKMKICQGIIKSYILVMPLVLMVHPEDQRESMLYIIEHWPRAKYKARFMSLPSLCSYMTLTTNCLVSVAQEELSSYQKPLSM